MLRCAVQVLLLEIEMFKEKLSNGWQLFKQAVAGDSDIDYTKGSIARVTLLIAVKVAPEKQHFCDC